MEPTETCVKLQEEQSRDKGIDMQSFGAMTGVDPFAVREIEQLMQYNSNNDLQKEEENSRVPPRTSDNLADLKFQSSKNLIQQTGSNNFPLHSQT